MDGAFLTEEKMPENVSMEEKKNVLMEERKDVSMQEIFKNVSMKIEKNMMEGKMRKDVFAKVRRARRKKKEGLRDCGREYEKMDNRGRVVESVEGCGCSGGEEGKEKSRDVDIPSESTSKSTPGSTPDSIFECHVDTVDTPDTEHTDPNTDENIEPDTAMDTYVDGPSSGSDGEWPTRWNKDGER